MLCSFGHCLPLTWPGDVNTKAYSFALRFDVPSVQAVLHGMPAGFSTSAR